MTSHFQTYRAWSRLFSSPRAAISAVSSTNVSARITIPTEKTDITASASWDAT